MGRKGGKFYDAVKGAWSAFQKSFPQRHRWLRKSSSRHMMWEEVAQRLKAVAASDPGISAIEHQDTLSLVVEGEVLCRVKHADAALVTQNYPTMEAQAFDDHDVDLFGFKGLQRVRLCYVLDQFETSLLWVGIAAHDRGKFLWKIELDSVGFVAQPERLPLREADVDTARLARLKDRETNSDEKKKKDDG